MSQLPGVCHNVPVGPPGAAVGERGAVSHSVQHPKGVKSPVLHPRSLRGGVGPEGCPSTRPLTPAPSRLCSGQGDAGAAMLPPGRPATPSRARNTRRGRRPRAPAPHRGRRGQPGGQGRRRVPAGQKRSRNTEGLFPRAAGRILARRPRRDADSRSGRKPAYAQGDLPVIRWASRAGGAGREGRPGQRSGRGAGGGDDVSGAAAAGRLPREPGLSPVAVGGKGAGRGGRRVPGLSRGRKGRSGAGVGGGRAAPGKRCQPEQRQRREGGAARRSQLRCPSALSPRRLGTCCGVMEEHGFPTYSARSPAWEELVGTCVPCRCTGVSYPFSCLYCSAGGSGYLSSLSVPSSHPLPFCRPRSTPEPGGRRSSPPPGGRGGVGAFRPRRVWPFAEELVPLGDGEFIALSEFHCPGGKPGISTESLAFNFAEGGGLDVDTVKRFLLAQQKQHVQAALGGSFQKETHTSPSFSPGARLGIAPIAAAKRDGARGTLLPPCPVGCGESAYLWAATKGGECPNWSGRKLR